MAKHSPKHTARSGQIKKDKHLADKKNRRKRLYNQPRYTTVEEGILKEEALEAELAEEMPEEAIETAETVTELVEAVTPAEPAPEAEEEAPKEVAEENEPEADASEKAKPEETPIAEKATEGKQLTFAEVFQEDEEKEKSGSALLKGIRIAVILIVIAVLLCVAYVMADKYIMSPDKFQKETTINSVDVSGLNEEQAKEKIRDTINSETLEILEDDQQIGTIKDYNFNYDFGDKVEKCLHPGYPNKFTRLFKKEDRNYTIKLLPTNQDDNFNKQFEKLDIVKHAKGTEETKNAYVDLSSHDFNVVSEVYGNSVDTDKLKQALRESIGANEMQFDYDAIDFRLEPKIKANSKEISDRLEYCKKYLGQEIKLNTFKGSYTIPPKEMNKFISADSQGNRVIKKKKLKKFVKKLRENFSYSGGTHDLHLVGGHVRVSGGDYGVYVDTSAEYKQLKKDLASNENVSRDMKYEGDRKPGDKNDIGSTYVEIDISKQRLWCVVDGKTVVKSDVVTGNVSDGHATPTGVYSIDYKVSPCTLRGENADGSKYESKVTYWMPFNGGIGCHDATWRGSFGGSIYQYSGSHGCVNMPYSKAEALYYQVDAGVPVVVHD